MLLFIMNYSSQDSEQHSSKKLRNGKRISKYPKAWPVVDNDIRKYIMHKYPYSIYYSVDKNNLHIVVIAHQHRKPNYWIDRIED